MKSMLLLVMFHIAVTVLFACNPPNRSFLIDETNIHKQEFLLLTHVGLFYHQAMLVAGSVDIFWLVLTHTWFQRAQKRWLVNPKKKVVSKRHRCLIFLPRSLKVMIRKLMNSLLMASCQEVQNFLRSPVLKIQEEKKRKKEEMKIKMVNKKQKMVLKSKMKTMKSESSRWRSL